MISVCVFFINYIIDNPEDMSSGLSMIILPSFTMRFIDCTCRVMGSFFSIALIQLIVEILARVLHAKYL
jgi:uncharacterized membrane protein